MPCTRVAKFSSCGVELVDRLLLVEVTAQLGHLADEISLAAVQALSVEEGEARDANNVEEQKTPLGGTHACSSAWSDP